MADDTCTCSHCRIRRAAFGFEQDIAEADFQEGLAALAQVFGIAVASANGLIAAGAVEIFTRGQNQAREQRERQRAANGDLASAEVAGHG